MGDSRLEIKIPETMVADTIRAEMVRQIIAGGAAEQWIKTIVEHAVSEKENSYDRTTKFGNAIAKMIREEAAAAFKEWLDENREQVRTALKKALERQGRRAITALVDNITAGLATISPKVKLEIDGQD